MSLFLQKIPPSLLLYLAEQTEPVLINEISFETRISQSQVSIIILKFESEKLVSTSKVGMAKLVKLTDKGREAAACTKALMSVVAA